MNWEKFSVGTEAIVNEMAKIKTKKGSGLPREVVPQKQPTLMMTEEGEVDYDEESSPLEVQEEPQQQEIDGEMVETPSSPHETTKEIGSEEPPHVETVEMAPKDSPGVT